MVLLVFIGQSAEPRRCGHGPEKIFIFRLAKPLAVCYDMAYKVPPGCVDPAGGFQMFWATGPEGVSDVYG